MRKERGRKARNRRRISSRSRECRGDSCCTRPTGWSPASPAETLRGQHGTILRSTLEPTRMLRSTSRKFICKGFDDFSCRPRPSDSPREGSWMTRVKGKGGGNSRGSRRRSCREWGWRGSSSSSQSDCSHTHKSSGLRASQSPQRSN